MGRRFTASSDERIHIGTTGLAGFDWRFGTQAVLCYRQTDTGSHETFTSTNSGDMTFGLDNSDRLFLAAFGTDRFAAGAVPTAVKMIIAVTKTTGTTTPRMHLYRFDTAVWTHVNASGTQDNSGAMTALTFGSYQDGAGSEAVDAEVWAYGLWTRFAMADGEIERLARGNWLSLSPEFYDEWTNGREVGDMVRTLGRHPAQQTARTGTTKGVLTPPAGFRMATARRRR